MADPVAGTPESAPEPNAAGEVLRLIEEARALWEQNALVASEAPLRLALSRAGEMAGADDMLVAHIVSHLGWVAAARGQSDEAVRLYRRALAIQEARLGRDDPESLRTVEALATVLFSADARDEEADALAVRVIAAYDAAGRDDPEQAERVATLAWRRYWVGRYAEAEPLFLRALAMRERLLGSGDAATADTAQRLAVMYDHLGFDADPEPYYRRALAGFEAAHDPDHPRAFEARYRLADHLDRQGREFEAATLFEDLVARILSPAPPVTPDGASWMLGACCDYLRDAGRDAEAEAIEAWADAADPFQAMCRADVEQAEAAFGPDSLEVGETLSSLANALAHAGRPDEAEAAARRVHAIRLARLGPDDPRTIEAADRPARARANAEWRAANRPAPRRLGRERPKLFDGEPWKDERRPDLIRAYLAAAAEERDTDDPTGAVMAIVGMSGMVGLDEQWGVILELIAAADEADDQVLQDLAAGPLESFVGRFDTEVIDRVEAEAARDAKFRRVLSGVWKHGMSDAVWARVRAIQATVKAPLPEMRPLDSPGPPGPVGGRADGSCEP